MKKVLIVGGGITSALTSFLLRQKLISDTLLHITIWDKARGPGGRMSTSRSNLVPNCKVDLGLQYISTTNNIMKQYSSIYDSLFSNNLLQPLKANITGFKSNKKDQLHFVTPLGSSSLVKHFHNLSNLNEVHYNTFLETLEVSKSNENQFECISKDGKTDLFDIVILTLPGPQIIELFKRSKNSNYDNKIINNIGYMERYALGLFYDETFDRPFDIKYFEDNDIIRYISFDNIKRNCPNEPISICVHTTVKFYREHNDFFDNNMSSDPNVVELIILQEINKLFPKWPLPTETKLQKWKFGQKDSRINNEENTRGFVICDTNPLLLFAGDSYVENSNFDNCIHSSLQVVDIVKRYLEQEAPS